MCRHSLLSGAGLLLAACFATHSSRAADAPPVAPVRDVVDEYWGQKVDDPYRYMENLKDPAVQSWIKGQADYATTLIGRLPERDRVLARIQELEAGRPYRIFAIDRRPDGRLFYQKIASDEELARLFTRASLDAEEKLLVDPSTMKPAGGGHYSLGFYAPSPDSKRVLYGLSPSGSEEYVLRVLDLASGAALSDSIDRMEAEYTPPQWLPDGSGFYYSRRRSLPPDAPETEGYKKTFASLHRLGTNADSDPLAFAMDLWPDVKMSDVDFPSIVLTPGSPYAIGKIKHGDANPLTLYAAKLPAGGDLSKRDGAPSPWKMICDAADEVTDFAVHGDEIYLMTSRGAPRFKIVRTKLAALDIASAETVVPASEAVVSGLAVAKDALYVEFRDGGAGRVARLAYGANERIEPLALPDQYPSGTVANADPEIDGMLVQTAAWTRAGKTYAYDPAKKTLADTRLNPIGKFDALPGYESVEVSVPGHDGTKIPLSIVYRGGIKLDGSNPALLTGYGAYGISRNVMFIPTMIAWLERGGVYAVAHVRGGGEYGEEWHRAGQKQTKPNTWKDFISCAEYLIAKGYTSPARLAGQGGSAGGILIGRAVTERPDLFAAGLFDVGCLDAVRMETTMNGVPNIPEFGTVKKEDEFRALLEMSAYHHVKDGVKYPAVMLSHGANDPRVEPWMSAKMCARMQAASASGKPVLFRVDYHAGHGIGSTKLQLQQSTADKFVFMLWQMGVIKPLP
jgi:prolyl oligopeptidase